MTWHANTDLLEHYLDDRLDPARAASLEQHLLACETCRGELARSDVMPGEALDAIWADVIDAVDRPRPLPVEWLLGHLGVRPHVARLLAATPSLHLSWLAGLALTLAAALLLSQSAGSRAGTPLIFLVIAPLLPLVGIAAAYGPGVDPVFEIGRAASFPSARLFLYRVVAVLVTSIGLSLLAAAFLPLGGWEAALWLLPALASAAVALALCTWLSPLLAAAVPAVLWVLAVSVPNLTDLGRPGSMLHRLVVFSPTGQLVAIAIAVAATAVFVVRLDRIDEALVRLTDPTDTGA